ncbi:MAG: hypothetical protein IT195_12155 [Microthrixaceae bacterium]|nr:hypothetical protein [Microthrixaceae bacterium]
MNMGGVPPTLRTRTGEVAWYLSASLGAAEAHEYAHASGGVVLRGEKGIETANTLRRNGWTGRIWLDPATYERPGKQSDLTLFGNRWAVAQDDLGVAERISPGSFVPAGDQRALRRGLANEVEWLERAGGGRASLALHAGWLVDGTQQVIDALRHLDSPVALALADPTDPLGRSGAVAGLVRIVSEVEDLMLLRGDLGALGAVAHGARQGAIGTSTIVRHALPPGKHGGGVPGDKTPSVFWPELLGFRLGSFIEQLPREAVPVCDLACCLGARLSRFNDERMEAEARVHNRLAIQALIDAVLQLADSERPGRFRSMCQQAIVETETLSVRARRQIVTSRQLVSWAELS